jgi:hypothetical protein
MPTLFRLLCFVGAVVAVAYGAMFAMVELVRPQPRAIQTAVALPAGIDTHTGRSAAEAGPGHSVAATLNAQADALVRHHHSRRVVEER